MECAFDLILNHLQASSHQNSTLFELEGEKRKTTIFQWPLAEINFISVQ